MFDLDAEVRYWRKRQERRSSLSPRELDELEDHLRARVDLELEFNGTLAPAQAFATARRELGKPVVLSQEFAKAGKPRWRRWLVAGWAMYVGTVFLPIATAFGGTVYGYEVFRDMILDIGEEWSLTMFNVPMVITVAALWGARLSCNRWLRRVLGIVGTCSLGVLLSAIAYRLVSFGLTDLWQQRFFAGCWTWSASYLCVANALRLRAQEYAPAKAEEGVGHVPTGA